MDIGANMGSARITGTTARSLALVYLAQRDYEAFDLLFPASLAAVRKFNDRHELAVSVAVAALADCMRGRQSGITQMLQESLQTAVESKIYASLMFSLPVLAQKLPSMGQAIRAVEIDALGRAFLGALYEDLVVRPYFGDQFAGAFSELPPEDVAAAEERGRHLNLWETVEELLIEMKQWG